MSRLISLFRSLSPKEVKQFGQFFQSPYYNTTPKMRTLYKYLKKTYPECSFTDEKKEKLFVQIFDEEAYSSKKMNNLTASLSSILQDFLLLQSMKKGTPAREQALYGVYLKRKLNKLSHQRLMGIKKTFDAPISNTFEYYKSLKLYHELYFHPMTDRVMAKEKEDYDYLKKAWQNLDLFYAHLRLRYLCEMIFRLDPFKKNYNLNLEEMNAIKHLIAHHHAPLLEIYFLLYTILRKSNKPLYRSLRNKTFDYINKYELDEYTFLLTFLKNYQIRQLSSGDTDALQELFNLYLFDLEKDIYMEEAGYFSLSHFANISVIASELGKADWLAAFIKEKEGYLRADNRENAVNFGLACLHFAKHEYGETIRLINLLRRTFPALSLTYWTLEVRAYYMMKDEHENWDSSIKRFQAYLRNQNKLDKKRMQANRNFNTFIRLLYRATYHSTYTKEELLAKLDAKQNIVCKYWLKKQIEQLK